MPYTGTSQNPTEGVVEYDVYYQNWSALDGGVVLSPGLRNQRSRRYHIMQNYGGKFDVVRAIALLLLTSQVH